MSSWLESNCSAFYMYIQRVSELATVQPTVLFTSCFTSKSHLAIEHGSKVFFNLNSGLKAWRES